MRAVPLSVLLEMLECVECRLRWYDTRGYDAPQVTERAREHLLEQIAARGAGP